MATQVWQPDDPSPRDDPDDWSMQLRRKVTSLRPTAPLHYSPEHGGLVVYPQIVIDGRRVDPALLPQLARTYDFRLPGCFHGLLEGEYVEGRVFVAENGAGLIGKAIAACNRPDGERCGFFVILSNYHTRPLSEFIVAFSPPLRSPGLSFSLGVPAPRSTRTTARARALMAPTSLSTRAKPSNRRKSAKAPSTPQLTMAGPSSSPSISAGSSSGATCAHLSSPVFSSRGSRSSTSTLPTSSPLAAPSSQSSVSASASSFPRLSDLLGQPDFLPLEYARAQKKAGWIDASETFEDPFEVPESGPVALQLNQLDPPPHALKDVLDGTGVLPYLSELARCGPDAGLTYTVFKSLWTQCKRCLSIRTSDMFHYHVCRDRYEELPDEREGEGQQPEIALPQADPPAEAQMSASRQILGLWGNSHFVGIPPAQFQELWVQCKRCRLVRVNTWFHQHRCSPFIAPFENPPANVGDDDA